MIEFVVVDMLFVALIFGAAWATHSLAQPPPSDAPDLKVAASPLHSTGHGIVSWTGSGFEIQKSISPLGETLHRICNGCGYRGTEVFLEGARLAYEDITNAFSVGDMNAQDHLLSDTVYEAFTAAMENRKGRNESVELTLIGVTGADILDAGLDNGQAWIDVRFAGAMVSVTRNAAGKIIAGSPNRVIETAEIWTFERDLRAAEPKWLLAATEADE